MADTIFLRNLSLTATVGRDCWHRDKAQPVLVSVLLYTNIKSAGVSDNVNDTINYGLVYKSLVDILSGTNYPTLDACAEEVCQKCLVVGGCDRVRVAVGLPKALLQAEGEGAGISMQMEMSLNGNGTTTILSKNLHVSRLRPRCIIGVNPHEREHKQIISLDLELSDKRGQDDKTDYQQEFGPLISVYSSPPILVSNLY